MPLLSLLNPEIGDINAACSNNKICYSDPLKPKENQILAVFKHVLEQAEFNRGRRKHPTKRNTVNLLCSQPLGKYS